jgi:diguanylate cyclase (GGDEF)-like protein
MLNSLERLTAYDVGMVNWFRSTSEPDDVYVALVSELFGGWIPAAVMGPTFAAIALFIALSLQSPFAMITTVVGGVLSIAKLGTMIAFRRSGSQQLNRHKAARWETGYSLISVGFAATVAGAVAATFTARNLPLQIVATGMLFGFCSGIVARASVRPRFAVIAVSFATVPVIAAALNYGGSAHGVLSATLLVFLCASIESIRHVHRAASRQIAMRLDMATLARNDPLTGLVNRLGLREAFREVIGERKHLPMVAVHCFDLDRFKPVNDRYGHPAGDTLLCQLAERIQAILRVGDVAARIGGDEFVVVQATIQHADEADIFARRLQRSIIAPFNIDEERVQIGVSLGYATSPPDACELDELLRTADAALYRMKRGGGGVARGDRDTAAA